MKMPWKTPKFWEAQNSFIPYLLEPFSWLYRGGAALHKLFSKPYRASIPVISVGNFVLGGAGKTPVTIAIAQKLQALGYHPHIISRGYGGNLSGPLCVDISQHHYHEVGDEPLLLARYAPTWISRNRRAAIPLAIQAGADVLLLDDAHQNYTIKKDLKFIVVEASQAFGNGHVFPAGPLRQTIHSGLKETSAIIFIKQDNEPLPQELGTSPCPIFTAKIVPDNPKPCVIFAFAGIGYPEKFRQTLISTGYIIKGFAPFPDHYPYTEEDLQRLQFKAKQEKASLITTEKDYMRIPLMYRSEVLTLPISLVFQPSTTLDALLNDLKHQNSQYFN
jgi:tetraacyldisaccharide 4'-kinase